MKKSRDDRVLVRKTIGEGNFLTIGTEPCFDRSRKERKCCKRAYNFTIRANSPELV